AAMFLTNKENFVADNGDYKGTQINSSNMLWSLAGSIAMVHKILFGIQYMPDALLFNPTVPYALRGNRSLTNFAYRNCVLNIELQGYGNSISSFSMDGKIMHNPVIPAKLKGTHAVKIILVNNKLGGEVNEVQNHIALPVAVPVYSDVTLSWAGIEGAKEYKIIRNGREISTTKETKIVVPGSGYSEYQVIAIDKQGTESFANEPVIAGEKNKTYEIEDVAETGDYPYKGFSGKGFVEISKEKNTRLQLPVNIEADGVYAIDFRYANGNGPTNTENKCAIRTLSDGSHVLGTVVFPQRGVGEWSNWGFSNPVQSAFKKGKHILVVSYKSWNENMNGTINQAMLDYMRVTKIR
ncbi:MAG: hypothetical protein ABJA57_08635, partial [Ginsengibacter sp.]